MDWKDALQNLRQDLPEVEQVTDSPAASSDSSKDKCAQAATLHVLLDRKGRKGKDATIVEGFELADNQVAAIASEMKRSLGVGGSSRGGEILIQGDKRDAVASFLKKKGFKVKL